MSDHTMPSSDSPDLGPRVVLIKGLPMTTSLAVADREVSINR